MTETEKRFYELMVIVSGELTEKEFEKELAEVRGMVTEAASTIDYEESWGKRDLAFKIKRQSRGYYVIFDFHAEPKQIKELSQNVKLQPMVLRLLLTQLPEDYTPGAYKTAMVNRRKVEEDEAAHEKHVKATAVHEVVRPVAKVEEPMEMAPKKPRKSVDDIVENPDIVM